MDLSLVGIDSTTAPARHDAAGMHLDEGRRHHPGEGRRRGGEGQVEGGWRTRGSPLKSGQRYKLEYGYDAVVGVHVESVVDGFGYRSATKHT